MSVPFNTNAGETIQLLCGDDAAQAAARIATRKRTGTTDAELVLQMAFAFQEALDQESITGDIGYQAPRVLDHGTMAERPRELKTGGQYSRRASEHSRKEEYLEAVADLARALLRPGIDETARDRLVSNMEAILKKAEKKRSQTAQDGDLWELFETLGIEDSGKDNAEIDRAALKKVYRELSVKYHPDKNPESAARFNGIRDAYEILSDPVKVFLYDTGGMDLVRKYEGGGDGLDRTDHIELKIHASLEDIYAGSTQTISTKRRVVCRSCRLHPHLPRCRACMQCPGETRTRQRWLNQHQYTVEEYEIPSEERCTRDVKQTTVSIERGMLSGDRLTHPFMASQMPKQIPGDLLISVMVKQHPVFKRIQNDLVATMHISLAEALLGFEGELKHLDGHIVRFGVPRGSVLKPGSGMEIQGEGMPLREDPTSFGRLIVKFEVDFPESVPAAAAADLEAALQAVEGPSKRRRPGSRRSEL